MHPAYRFPRSNASLDLTDPTSVPPPAVPSGSQSHPSLLITDSYGEKQPPAQGGLNDAEYLARFESATRTLLDQSTGLSTPNPAHLSAASYPAKPLSRISEYSESAYSLGAYSRNSQEPFAEAPSRASSPATSPVDPAFGNMPPSLSFPAPPVYAAHLSAQSAAPPVPVTTPTSPQPTPSLVRASGLSGLTVTNPDAPSIPSEGASPSPSPSITRHHLPSRPLTTPLPLSAPAPVPVPLDNFAAPPSDDRSASPAWSAHQEVMVQLPGRGPVLVGAGAAAVAAGQQQQQRFSRHIPDDSQSTTIWATAEDEKFDPAYGTGGYDGVSLVQSNEVGSSNRFTLDDAGEGYRAQRKGSAASSTGTQGWDPEVPKRGANRRLWWAFAVLVIIGVAVGVGVGVGKRQADERRAEEDRASASPSSASASASASLPSIVRPSATSGGATTTYSTTFGYERSGSTTVVPLTYTIPTSYFTRGDGRYQFTEDVVLPELSGLGSFTSELRFRVAPTGTASGAAEATVETAAARREKREAPHRHERERRMRLIR
ncbi:uncharacterized protein JCM10292_005016 [Rhodotorula paludigena]|uniref:uncharacterized protein n=1 Tax=Rhodotorula paludigena TaxID=86838 RepID=UPI003180FD87